MSLIIKDTPTLSSTGGTTVTFVESKRENGLVTYIVAEDSLASRRVLKSTVKEPKKSATSPSGYTQARNLVEFLFPITLSDGSVVFNTARLELSVDINITDAQRISLLDALLDACITTGALRSALMDSVQPNG